MMWRPGDGLHRGNVLGVGVNGLQTAEIPHEEFVVVAARGEVLIVRGPLQTAHLLTMTGLLERKKERARSYRSIIISLV